MLLLASLGLLIIDADQWNLFTHDKLPYLLSTTFTLAYDIIAAITEWLSLLILLNAGRGLAKARGDYRGIFNYGRRVIVVHTRA